MKIFHQKREAGFGRGATIALIVFGGIIVLGVLGTWLIYKTIQNNYTSPTPVNLTAPALSPEKQQDLAQRIQTFKAALSSNTSVELRLTGDEINSFIGMNPDWKEVQGKFLVKIQDDKLFAETSIPMDKVYGFKGRYFNGTMGLRFFMENGKLYMFAEHAEVNGKPLPRQFMDAFAKENLMEKANQKPNVKEVLSKFKGMKIDRDVLVIQTNGNPPQPKPAPRPPSSPKSIQSSLVPENIKVREESPRKESQEPPPPPVSKIEMEGYSNDSDQNEIVIGGSATNSGSINLDNYHPSSK